MTAPEIRPASVEDANCAFVNRRGKIIRCSQPAFDEIRHLREALAEIAEHPGPNADDAAWMRVEVARDALKTAPETDHG